jgi:hypothetical protein
VVRRGLTSGGRASSLERVQVPSLGLLFLDATWPWQLAGRGEQVRQACVLPSGQEPDDQDDRRGNECAAEYQLEKKCDLVHDGPPVC